MRSAVLLSRAALVLGVVAGCSGRSVDAAPKSCSADADCVAGQRCEGLADRPVIGLSPCAGVVSCAGEVVGVCATDEICAPGWQRLPDYAYCGEMLCAPRCSDASCPPDAACMPTGLCELTQCDGPGAAACSERWRCDPSAAATASHEPARGTSISEDALEMDRNLQRGCVRLTCAETGGYACAAAWSCDPGATINPAGCIPDECKDTGHCADDTTLVCRSKAQHLDHGSLDLNGCVPRTCDDGYSCSRITEAGIDVGACRYGAPNADYYGCVVLPCMTDDECFYDYVCDHASSQADERGCRQQSCTEGAPCPDGFVCDPKAVQHDGADCTTPEFASSGGASGTGAGGSGGSPAGGATSAGGTGGTSARAGSGGTAGSGASASKPPLRGQCVAR
jgi:hypothetical protein